MGEKQTHTRERECKYFYWVGLKKKKKNANVSNGSTLGRNDKSFCLSELNNQSMNIYVVPIYIYKRKKEEVPW